MRYDQSKRTDKATVVRAVYYDILGNKSDIITGVYFVGFQDKAAYDGINIVSIVADPNDLFGEENGIYVEGVDYHKEMTEQDMTRIQSIQFVDANYRRKGKSARRNAEIEFWDEKRNSAEKGQYKLAIQGNVSREWIPKSFNLYPKKSSWPSLHSEFGEYIDGYTLTTGSQDRNFKAKDVLVNELLADSGLSTRHYIPYAVFLEGEYWGMYFLTERYDESFFKNKYGIEDEELIYQEWVGRDWQIK